jgi:nitrogen fixation NifU-like protein
MAYSKKVVDKFENTINEPAKYNVGRFDPKEMNVGTWNGRSSSMR